MIEKVIMKITIEVPVPKGHRDYSIGGFNFIIDGDEVPFDFNIINLNFSKNKENNNDIVSSTHKILLDGSDIIDESYPLSYIEIGLIDDRISAEFLSKTEEIREFYFEPDKYTGWFDFQIIDIDFYDESETKFSVSKEILDKFNSNIVMDVVSENIFSDDYDYNGDELIQ